MHFKAVEIKIDATYRISQTSVLMKLLLITNLYPPQELGGYGRSMADFVWGIQRLGHQVFVVTSNAPYLAKVDSYQCGPNDEQVWRLLELKGGFSNGISIIEDPTEIFRINQHNQSLLRRIVSEYCPDGVLLGNLDLLGPEVLQPLIQAGCRLIHHVGFISPPFGSDQRVYPFHADYQIAAASQAVRHSLLKAGLPVSDARIIYPGARCEMFGSQAHDRSLPAPLGPCLTAQENEPLGSPANPLLVCFAGLLMFSKGPHTLAEAMLVLRQRGLYIRCSFAGGSFQKEYTMTIKEFFYKHGLDDDVLFCGQLSRTNLGRFFRLNHVAVFTSTYPEAFGIVAAEAMASGLVLVSTGVGGAAELFEDGVSGFRFCPGDPNDLADLLQSLMTLPPSQLREIAKRGEELAYSRFSVLTSARQLVALFGKNDSIKDVRRGNITF